MTPRSIFRSRTSLRKRQAVHAGHPQVADREAGAVVLVQELQGLPRVVERAHGEPRLLDGDRHRFAGAGFVVDHQNEGLVRHARAILAQSGVGVEKGQPVIDLDSLKK